MKSTLLAGALICTVAATGCVASVDSQALIVRDEKRFTVTGTPQLDLKTFDGAIEIRSWDQSGVLVEIEKRGATREAVDALEVVADQHGNRIRVEVKKPSSETFSGIGFHRSTSAKLIVSVPGASDIKAQSGDGSIRVERVTGTLELRTGDGSIRGVEVAGDLVLNTGDGSVRVDGAQGTIDVDTGDGSVEVAGKLTAVKLHTGDGSIVYRAQDGSTMTEDWEISTGDGGVTMYLPRDFSAELDAHTGDGGIRNELEVEHDAGAATPDRRTVRGRIGDGGKLLRIRTGDGSIRLRPS